MNRVHLKLKPFRCDYLGCGRTFSSKGHRDEHFSAVHLGESTYHCDHEGCQSSFKRQSDLKTHNQTVHLKQKPFLCDECRHTFGLKVNLARHVKTVHEKQKPYVCRYSECSAAFGEKSTLDNHISTVHEKQKPFCCPVQGCLKAFGLKGTLDGHIKFVHLGIRDYQCTFPLCDFCAVTNSDLKRHFRQMHSQEALQRQKREEQKVAKALEEAGINFKREHHVSFDCWDDTFARVDFVTVKDGCVLFSEVDEGQHGWYGTECEVSRMTKIHAACVVEGNTLPMGMIRYNPHAFRVDGQLRRVSTKDRLAKLVDVIRNWQCDPQGGLQVQYMYYDCFTMDDGLVLNIWDDDYNQEVRACCRDPII